ncbi:DNA polymerase I [Occallatibacter riparius]|uniref:DNA polymerase I n=1 Tax=Occallatibacter riparius TaxID=1002689 RepID=A0A9J7BQU6_9BACT|nr:DNA polymerase I [Occallatibacter riparius]UWZ83310.1 DNA polymerase I [Occallatibacter riparius]
MPDQAKPPVFLLDTMNFIFRAYHAMQRSRPMSTRSGLPTAATYVFVNMIRKLRQDFSPHYFAAVFDVSGKVFRDDRAKEIGSLRKWNSKTQCFEEVGYEGYKAKREAMPEDLVRQIPFIRRSLEVFRIPILEAEGFEADDVIGTLSCRAAEQGHDVYIVSGDKDMMQLVNERVKVLNPQKDNLVLDAAKVEEVLGVPPSKVIDVMALRGDTIDNIPGAPGIGDKGSVDLIKEFGSLEAVLDRAEEVKRKTYRESLQHNRDAVLLSKELVTIDCNVPLQLDLTAMVTQEPDLEGCRELFTELEFTSWLKELAPAESAVKFELIESPTAEQRAAFFSTARASGFAFAMDAAQPAPAAESDEEPAQPTTMSLLDVAEAAEKQADCSIGVCAEPGVALALQLNDELRSLLGDSQVPKRVHDMKAAMHALRPQGAKLHGAIDDVMLLSYALNPTHTTQSLADVAARNGHAPPASLTSAAAIVNALAPALRTHAEESDVAKVYDTIDLPLAPVLYRMEEAGVRIDKRVLSTLSTRFGAEIERLGERIYELAGQRFNINSPKQLGVVLFTHMGLPAPVKYGKGKTISTAQDVLEQLAEKHEVPRLVLEYRHVSKLKSTYIDQLPLMADADSRVHTTFQAAATSTGRLSSINPNLQNIPIRTELGREIRAAFTAAPGSELLSADYSQIELRLLAHFSNDPLLVRAYQTGEDIHTLTASEVFGVPVESMDKETRARAKAVNFGIVYGISPFGLAAQLGIAQAEARAYIERYFARYQGVQAFIEKTLAETRRTGSVRTLFGRVRPIPDIESRNPNQRGFAERTAVNTPLQGTAADLIKLAMIALDAKITDRKLKTRMVLQVHDELLFEVPADEKEEVEELVRAEMEGVVKLNVPLVADLGFGPNWRDL